VNLPIEKTSPSHAPAEALCPTLVQNALKPAPHTTAEAPAPFAILNKLRICAEVCTTLAWRNGRFEVMARDGQLATIYTVENFTPNSIVIRRAELPPRADYGPTAIYKGAFAEAGEPWTSPGRGIRDFRIRGSGRRAGAITSPRLILL